jgi:hypothetical protein
VTGFALPDAAVHYPTPWIILASVFCGAALARATRRVRGGGKASETGRDPDAERNRKWTLFALCMSASVIAWLLAVFVPGPERVADPKYVVYYLALSLVLGVAFRFPKTAGIAIAVVAVAACAVGILFSTALLPVRGPADTGVGTVAVYAARDGGMDVEVHLQGVPPGYARLRGDRIAGVVETLVFDDLWPGLGWRRWYRTRGVTAFAITGTGTSARIDWADQPFLVERPSGVAEILYGTFEAWTGRFPGVTVTRSELVAAETARSGGEPGIARELATYALTLHADGSVTVREAGPQATSGK